MKKIEPKTFIHNKFTEYYQQHSESIEAPSQIESREFAFLMAKEKVMLRHKGFKEPADFQNALKNLVPSHVYYSTAYYEKPEEPMNAKEWLGADLFFDIDADHIPTTCNKMHDTWKCANCGERGHGMPPDFCPKCKGQRFDDKTWACEVCLRSAKQETIKLTDTLMGDFGLSSQEIDMAFSGHRGYHISIEAPEVQELDQGARREIVDYMVGVGFEPKLHGLEAGINSNTEEIGLGGRIVRIYDLLLNSRREQLKEMGLKENIIEIIANQKERVLDSQKSQGSRRTRGITPGRWKKILQKIVEIQSIKIDTVVTPDIHRLIRLTDTLHGKTGLRKVDVPINGIEGFDPLESAVAFKEGTVEVVVSEAPEFRIGDQMFGPYSDKKVELPTAAAMFLLCKGAARLTEEN